MKLEEGLATLNAVLDALPDSFEQQHAERLQQIRNLLSLVLLFRQMER